MFLLIAIETFFIFPVLFVERFIYPSASVDPNSSASVASNTLHKIRSFGLRCTLHNFLAVLVEEVKGLLAVLWVTVVSGCEVILQVHF